MKYSRLLITLASSVLIVIPVAPSLLAWCCPSSPAESSQGKPDNPSKMLTAPTIDGGLPTTYTEPAETAPETEPKNHPVSLSKKRAQLSDGDRPRIEEVLSRIRLRLDEGTLSLNAARQWVSTLPATAIKQFFARKTHMDGDWFQAHGIPPERRRKLLSRWISNEPLKETNRGRIGVSPYGDAEQTLYRLQNQFDDDIRSIHLHYTLPPDYLARSVIIKWYDTSNRSLTHLDRHHISENPQLPQQAWLRRESWPPGKYRVEIYAADNSLDVLSTTSFNVEE